MVGKLVSPRPRDKVVSNSGPSNVAEFKQTKQTQDRLNGDAALPSVFVGSPSGGNKGAGSVNAETIYLNGAELTPAATTPIGTADGDLVQVQTGGKLPALDGSNLTGISQSGRLIAGAPLVLNPYATTHANQAHGLGAQPDFVILYLECLTAEDGYSIGDRVYSFTNNVWTHSSDATNLYFSSIATGVGIVNKSSTATALITVANWKLVITPYKLS